MMAIRKAKKKKSNKQKQQETTMLSADLFDDQIVQVFDRKTGEYICSTPVKKKGSKKTTGIIQPGLFD